MPFIIKGISKKIQGHSIAANGMQGVNLPFGRIVWNNMDKPLPQRWLRNC